MKTKIFGIFLLGALLLSVSSFPAYSQTWSEVSPPWGPAARLVESMAVYAGYLYVGTNPYGETEGAGVWRYNGAWIDTSPPWGDTNEFTLCMAEYAGHLYVGTRTETGGGQVWRYDGTTWTNVTPPYMAAPATLMAAYGSNLYVGETTTYAPSPNLLFGWFRVWRYDGTSWTNVTNPPLGLLLTQGPTAWPHMELISMWEREISRELRRSGGIMGQTGPTLPHPFHGLVTRLPEAWRCTGVVSMWKR